VVDAPDRAMATRLTSDEPAAVPRWMLALAVPAALLSLWIVAGAVGDVLTLFIVACVMALLLNPLVRRLGRAHIRRGPAVALVFLLFLALIGLTVYLVIDPARSQVEEIRRNLPAYTADAERQAADLQAWLADHGVHVDLTRRVHDALPTLERWLSRQSDHLLSYSWSVVRGLIETIVVIVSAIYMLLDAPRIARFGDRLVPRGATLLRGMERGLSRWLRAQVLVSAIIGTSVGLSMWVYGLAGIFDLGETYAVAFGLWAFFMEFVPYAGPILGAIPPIALAASSGGALTTLWVVLAFVVIQELEGHLVVPLVMGRSISVHPLVVIFALLVGGILLGPVGVLLALPLVVILREIAVFVSERTRATPSPEAAQTGDVSRP
jgi:predicted PurR-regulated permease PerM